MIKVKINYDGNVIKGFKVSGHANYDEYGKDIVCASVSTVVITSINLALKIDEKSVVVTDKPGLIEVNILKRDDVINKIFINMKDMLVELQKDYSKNIKIL